MEVRDLANRSEGSGGRAGLARSVTAKQLADTAHRGLARNIHKYGYAGVPFCH